MVKVTLALGVVLAIIVAFVAESSCQKFILPTFRPPVRSHGPKLILPTFRPPVKPIVRWVREAGDLPPATNEEPVYELHTERPGFESRGEEHPYYNLRETRSLDSPSAKRGGGSPRSSSGSRNTGPTHPGYNRRNAREIRLPGHLNPLRPKPLFPRPTFPAPVPRIPILVRTARDIQIPGVKKPTHRDIIIPNWNPNVKTSPWNRIGGRHRRSLDLADEDFTVDVDVETVTHGREPREVHISGLPELKKPTHRDVIIPNWNPHVRTNPWQRLGGRRN